MPPISQLIGKLPEEKDNYIKFADGTLIQWGIVNFPSESQDGSGYYIGNFKIPFVSIPSMTASPVYVSTLITFDISVSTKVDSFVIYARKNSGEKVTGAFAYWIAIGRWK